MFRFATLAVLAALALPAPGLPASAATAAPACAPQALTLTGERSGDGMPYGTALLTLKNTSGAACTVAGHPHVSLLDASGSAVVADATTAAPRFMHPGPVIVPLRLEPGASLTTEIRWLRGDGDPSHASCSPIATVVLEGTRAPLGTTICAADAAGAKPRLEVKLYNAA